MEDNEALEQSPMADAVGEPDAPEQEQDTQETQTEEQPQEQEREPDSDEAKRNARLAHEAREAKKLMRQYKAELEALKGERPPPPPDEEMERKIEERARQKAQEKAFTDMCNAVYDAGIKDFGKKEFEDSLKALQDQTGTQIPYAIVEAAHEAGNAHKVLKYLADNPDIYDDMLHVPVHRMGAKLARIASKLETPKKEVSKAPPPIKPVTGATKGDVSLDDMPIEDFIKLRNQEELKRRGRL